MISKKGTVTNPYDSTDSTATSAYEWSKLVTDCKPASDLCWCNNKGSFRRCRCLKARNICPGCLPLQHDHCMNNKNIRSTFLTSNTTTIKNDSTNPLPNLLANSTPPHANQVSQLAAVMPSAFLTSLFPTASLYLIAVGAQPVEARQDWGGNSILYWRLGTYFKCASSKQKEEKFQECFMMDTVVYTDNFGEIARAVV